MLRGPQVLKSLNSIEKIHPRMMVATFNGNPRATIISCYSPTNVSEENRLTCLNTNFQKTEGKLWTYTYANNTKAQIDYVFINKKWKNSAVNSKAYSSFVGVSSNHRIVMEKYD